MALDFTKALAVRKGNSGTGKYFGYTQATAPALVFYLADNQPRFIPLTVGQKPGLNIVHPFFGNMVASPITCHIRMGYYHSWSTNNFTTVGLIDVSIDKGGFTTNIDIELRITIVDRGDEYEYSLYYPLNALETSKSFIDSITEYGTLKDNKITIGVWVHHDGGAYFMSRDFTLPGGNYESGYLDFDFAIDFS